MDWLNYGKMVRRLKYMISIPLFEGINPLCFKDLT